MADIKKTISEITTHYLDWRASPSELIKLQDLLNAIEDPNTPGDPAEKAKKKMKQDLGQDPDAHAVGIIDKIFKKDLNDKSTKLSSDNILSYICTVAGVSKTKGKTTAVKPPNPWE